MGRTLGGGFEMKRFLVIAIFVLCCTQVRARELNVPSIDYPTIQSAIDDANDGDTVVVSAGTYQENIDFLGRAITVQSADPNDPNVVAATIIDCQGSVSESHRGFYFHSGEDANSIIDGLTVTNAGGYYRGAVYCYGSSPTYI